MIDPEAETPVASVFEEPLEAPSDEPPILALLPSSHSIPTYRSTSPLTPLVCDERVIARLLAALLRKSGLSIGEASRRMGVTSNTIRQYLKGRRQKPSLLWFVKLAELCEAKVYIEFPEKGGKRGI